MLNNVSIQTRPCNLSCMHMQHLFLLFNASFSSNCKWKSLLYFFNFESYWSCNIKVWRWKNFEMIVFQKDKKIPSFSKSKLLLSINNQNINLTKWNQSILVAVLIILGFRHQNIKHGVTIIQTGQLLVLQGSEMVMTSEKKSLWY